MALWLHYDNSMIAITPDGRSHCPLCCTMLCCHVLLDYRHRVSAVRRIHSRVCMQGGDAPPSEAAAPQSRRNEKRFQRGGRGGPVVEDVSEARDGPQNTRKRRAVRPPEAGAAPLTPKHAGMLCHPPWHAVARSHRPC